MNGGCACSDCATPMQPLTARDLRDAQTPRLEADYG